MMNVFEVNADGFRVVVGERDDGRVQGLVWEHVAWGETGIGGFVGSLPHVVECIMGLQQSHGLAGTVACAVQQWFDRKGQ